jgi:early secretory antigenic target protein ESAT-6
VTADSSYMNIRFETLDQAQNDLAMAFASIQATVQDLESQLESSLSQWTGSAQDAYRAARLQWDNALADMAGVLQRAHVHLANAAEMYQTVENQNLSIWHG